MWSVSQQRMLWEHPGGDPGTGCHTLRKAQELLQKSPVELLWKDGRSNKLTEGRGDQKHRWYSEHMKSHEHHVPGDSSICRTVRGGARSCHAYESGVYPKSTANQGRLLISGMPWANFHSEAQSSGSFSVARLDAKSYRNNPGRMNWGSSNESRKRKGLEKYLRKAKW